MSILSQFTFKGRQAEAALSSAQAIAVTAGAGSGKTRVLTGRYLHLLENGRPLRSLVAITFTEKAAREMRTRVRGELERWAAAETAGQGGPTVQGGPAAAALTELDAARIGTIHGLCAEILRAHPAEAGIDPGFSVLEEGRAAAWRAAAADAALAWAAGDPNAARLFASFKESELRRLLAELFGRRLDLQNWLSAVDGEGAAQAALQAWAGALQRWLDQRLATGDWQEALSDLAQLQARTPDDKLELARREVLAHWAAARAHLAGGEWDAAFAALVRLRKAARANLGTKTGWDPAALEAARAAMRALCDVYDDQQLGDLASKSSWALDEQAARLTPALRQLGARALAEYTRLKDEQQALDFDDLEGRAAALLRDFPGVRARWQNELRAVLVDEFQDTNDRQRQIVYALSGFSARPGERLLAGGAALDQASTPGSSLFIVGDAKQSIYKFRGADVAVFRQVQADIAAAGGLAVDLDLTFRAHQPLLDQLNPLLAAVLGADEPAENQPYRVPFAPLRANRSTPEKANPPYLEFHVGLGADADEGRAVAAQALAGRLLALHAEGFEWTDMALLFRASTAFPVYEDALEQAGIPFVTVAGRGFYGRPEIRDLLNALAAIADPSNDLALAGALRSPAFALSDADLYRLFAPPPPAPDASAPGETGQALRGWPALCAAGDPVQRRAAAILGELHALAGRAPAAEVLKRLLDLTGYRAILQSVPGGERMRRNVEKLLADAHRSQLVGLGEFLEYVQTLRDVGLREGEAPVEAGGAVQLMTVHKSKGLEFPLVVIADAAHESRPQTAAALLDPRWGGLPGLKDDDKARPVTWRLASQDEQAKGEAEDQRLLYVAATRAREKLLVSGYGKLVSSGKLQLGGWLGELGRILGINEGLLDGGAPGRQELEGRLPGVEGVIPWSVYPASVANGASRPRPALAPLGEAAPGDLLQPLVAPPPDRLDERSRARESDPPERVWRVTPRARRPSGPAWVVGKLVHEALRRWRFPGDGFEAFIEPFAFEAGLADRAEIRATVRLASRLLERFYAHPLRAEIEAAERYHELPYLLAGERGVLDLLYRRDGQWIVVDFKTDEARQTADVPDIIRREGYDQQVRRYVEAVSAWLGVRPLARLVFLQAGGGIVVVEVRDEDEVNGIRKI